MLPQGNPDQPSRTLLLRTRSVKAIHVLSPGDKQNIDAGYSARCRGPSRGARRRARPDGLGEAWEERRAREAVGQAHVASAPTSLRPPLQPPPAREEVAGLVEYLPELRFRGPGLQDPDHDEVFAVASATCVISSCKAGPHLPAVLF